MSPLPNELRCQQDNTNALKDFQKGNITADDCNRPRHVPAAGLGTYSQCCRPTAISPVVACESPVAKVSATDDHYCDKTTQRSLIPKHVKIQECACVKFNGLQDSCQHPACRPRVGCFDVPFPNCRPACEWKHLFGKISYGNKNTNNC